MPNKKNSLKLTLLVAAIAACFLPLLTIPLVGAISHLDLYQPLRHLPGATPAFILAIALASIGTIASTENSQVTTVIKFSVAVAITQYLLMLVGFWLLPRLELFQLNKGIFALSMSFFNGFLFAILVRPILHLPLNLVSSFAVGAACLIALLVCVSQGYHWFWRFVVVGLLSTCLVAANLTRSSRQGTAQSAVILYHFGGHI